MTFISVKLEFLCAYEKYNFLKLVFKPD